jgi:D-arabinono-1,4-lactone oxidase
MFYAVGVSMGLFGVITRVTFRLEQKAFFVKGTEVNREFENSFLKDENALNSSLIDSNNEYYHLNWFPQKHCNRVMQWTGKQVSPDEAARKSYIHTLRNPLKAYGASVVLQSCNFLLSRCPEENNYQRIGTLLNIFVDVDSNQEFCDDWFNALPNDNQAHIDTFMKVDFTEVWVPRHQYAEVLQRLKK